MNIQPLRAERFLKATLKYIEPFKGNYIYNNIARDYMEKTDQVEAGYGYWLQHLLEYLSRNYRLEGRNILDFGCGTGELTVRMNTLGFQVTGLDTHEKHLALVRILAEENQLSKDIFILNRSTRLLFNDNRFDIVTMFSVLEHLSNATLSRLFPEFDRVCWGVIYILVPNRLKIGDDHTGLHFVPWMPHRPAAIYVKIRSTQYLSLFSRNQPWDVYYRSFSRIVSLFEQYGFNLNFPKDDVVYPPLDLAPPIFRIDKKLRLGTKTIFIGLPSPWKMMIKLGYPK